MKSGSKEGEVWFEFHGLWGGAGSKMKGRKDLKKSGKATDTEVTL